MVYKYKILLLLISIFYYVEPKRRAAQSRASTGSQSVLPASVLEMQQQHGQSVRSPRQLITNINCGRSSRKPGRKRQLNPQERQWPDIQGTNERSLPEKPTTEWPFFSPF